MTAPLSSKSQFDARLFPVIVQYCLMDGEWLYEANCATFPHVWGYEPTAQAAYDTVIEAIDELHTMAVEMGQPFPESP